MIAAAAITKANAVCRMLIEFTGRWDKNPTLWTAVPQIGKTAALTPWECAERKYGRAGVYSFFIFLYRPLRAFGQRTRDAQLTPSSSRSGEPPRGRRCNSANMSRPPEKGDTFR